MQAAGIAPEYYGQFFEKTFSAKNISLLLSMVLTMLLISGSALALSSVTVTAPNTPVVWGGTHDITWTSPDCALGDKVNLYLGTGGTIGFPTTSQLIVANVDCSASKYSWNTAVYPYTDGTSYQIKVSSSNDIYVFDHSDSFFTIDNTAPTVPATTLTIPNGGETWAGGSSQTITWNAGTITDTNLGATPISLSYTTDGSTWTPIISGIANSGSYSWTVPAINSGSVKVKITVTDLAGNSNSDVSDAVFMIDSTKPTISSITPVSSSYTNDNTPTISASLNDVGSGINAGTIVVRIDGTSVTATYASGVVSYTPAVALPDGSHTVTIDVSDNAGNPATQASTTFTVDTTAPVVTITPVTTPTNLATQTITGIYTETNIDVILVNSVLATLGSGTYSATVSLPAEGANPISVVARDKAGNTGSASTSIVKDTVAPTTTDDATGTWTGSAVSVTLTPSDSSPSSGFAWTKYCTTNGCDPSTGTDYISSVSISTEGTTYFRYASQDKAGNTQATVSKEIKIDYTAPTVTSVTAPATSNTQTFDITYAASDAGSGVDAVKLWYKLNGGSWTEAGVYQPSTGTISFTALVVGSYEFYVQAKDKVGNAGSAPTPSTTSTAITTANPLTVYVYTSGNGGHVSGWDAFNTIQEAIAAVAAGGTVNVAAGTYTEQVLVTKSVHILGAGSSSTIITAPASLVVGPNSEKSIISMRGSGVSAEFSGFTVTGSGADLGMFVRDGANANIHDNIINAADMVSVFVGRKSYGTTGTATIANNVINGYQKGGIVVDNAGSSAAISGNTITGSGATPSIAQNGIQVSRGATGTITGNTVSGHVWTGTYGGTNDPITDINADGAAGILLYESGSGTETSGNILIGNQFGIWTVATPNVNIHDNTITGLVHTGNAFPTGIAIWSADMWASGEQGTSGTINSNTLSTNDYGIIVRDYTAGGASPSVVAHSNSITGSSVYNAWSNAAFDAAKNWWGNKQKTSIVPTIAGSVNYIPWYLDAGKTTLSSTDTTGPTVVLENNIGGRTAVRDADSVTIKATFTDTNGLDTGVTPTISILGTTVTNALMSGSGNVWTYAWDVPAGEINPATVSVSAMDIVGNLNSPATGVTSYIVDNTPPADPTNVAGDRATSAWSNDNTVTVTWTAATDSGSGLDGYSVLWDNLPTTAPDTVKDIEEGVQTATSPALIDGNDHYFHISSVDNAGNWVSTVHRGPFFIDTVKPSSSAASPAYVNLGTIDVAFTASDDRSGVASTRLYYRFNGGTWTDSGLSLPGIYGVFAFNPAGVDGTYEFYTVSTDNAGNVEDAPVSADSSTVFDDTFPTIVSQTIDNPDFSPDGDKVKDATTITLGFSETVYYHIRILDSLGRVVTSWSGKAKNPEPKVWDGMVDNAVHPDNGKIAGDGVYVVEVTYHDAAGNTVTSRLVDTILLDTQNPTTTDNAPSAWQTSKPVTVALTPSDPAISSGVLWTRYCTDTTNTCDPASGTGYTVPVEFSAEGTTYLRYASQDNAGNTQATVSKAIKIDTVDPIVGINGVKTPTNVATQLITGTFTEENLASITVNGVAADVVSNTYSKSVSLSEGDNTITVVATDLAGRTATATATIVLDTIPPAVEAGANKTTNTEFTQNATVSGATSYVWGVASGNPEAITFGTPIAEDTTVSASADGTYVLNLTAADAAGNSASDTMNLIWDTHAPIISGVTGDVKTKVGVPTTITATITDATSGVSSAALHYTLPGSTEVAVPMDHPAGNTYTAQIPALSNAGVVTYYITAIDTAGNNARNPNPTTYTITVYDLILNLNAGWNLVSVPTKLEGSNTLADVFPGAEDTIWTYRASADPAWVNADSSTLETGYGYWVNYPENATVGVNYEKGLGTVGLTFPEVPLTKGWNLIGTMTAVDDPEYMYYRNVLSSLMNEYRYDSYDVVLELNPEVPGGWSIPYYMESGKGYWIYMNQGDTYINTVYPL